MEHGPCPEDQNTALLYIDLNKFKLINDTMGHKIGDILLCRAPNIIRREAGEDRFVARLGGDEFVILKRVDKASCAKVIGLSIMEEFAQPQVIHGNPVASGASVAIAISPQDGTDPEELLRRADIAMCKGKGIAIALDDFGTGYSSLSYIQDFPFDKVKIDRCFVSTMDSSPHSAAVVRCIVNLASSLGMIGTAEGVEIESQELLLKFIGCQTLQGYRYAKPMPFADLVALVKPGLSASTEKVRQAG